MNMQARHAWRVSGAAALVFGAAAMAAPQQGRYDWQPSLIVKTDLDRSGQLDSAQLGIAAGSIGLRVIVDGKSLPVVDIPIDGSKQFGVCAGTAPSIRVVAQSEAPLNALGETPQGYQICDDCREIVVSGGECDPLHFYWNTMLNRLSWWRT